MQFVAVEPADARADVVVSSAVLPGDDPAAHEVQGIGPGFQPSILDLKLIDRVLPVSERASMRTARECARLEGIPIGISSGGPRSMPPC